MTTKKTTGAKGKPGAKGKGKPKAAPAFVAAGHSNGATFTAERPGVLATLYELMWAAEQNDAPMSKAEVLAECVRLFSDRPAENMKTTISAQLPGQFKLARGFVLTRVLRDDGVIAFKLDSAASERYIIEQLDLTGAAKYKRPLPWQPVTAEGKKRLAWRGAQVASAS